MFGLGKKKSFWSERVIALAIAVAIVCFAAGYLYSPGCTSDGSASITGALTAQDAAVKALDFINSNMLPPGMSASLNNISEKNGLYVLSLSVGDDMQKNDYESYVTKDGGLLFVAGVDLDQEIEQPEQPQTPQGNPDEQGAQVLQSERPVVEAFVMSHCPYGTQVEKGLLPVVNLLGDKIDFSVKFVFYAMHGKQELDEQLLQYCVQKGSKEEYLDYLTCFLQEGNTNACVTETGIDTVKLNQCIQATDEQFNVTGKFEDQSTWLNGRFPLFDVHKIENEVYGVRGSPALIINGAEVRAGRDSASLLTAICAAFIEAPAECETELSSETPAPGFGFTPSAAGAPSGGTCG